VRACVRVWERERESARAREIERARDRERECVCVFVCERERERKKESEKKKERERTRERDRNKERFIFGILKHQGMTWNVLFEKISKCISWNVFLEVFVRGAYKCIPKVFLEKISTCVFFFLRCVSGNVWFKICWNTVCGYGVTTISRLLQIIGLFCKICSL